MFSWFILKEFNPWWTSSYKNESRGFLSKIIGIEKFPTRWFKVAFLGWLSDSFKGLSDPQQGDKKVTLNHLAHVFWRLEHHFFLNKSQVRSWWDVRVSQWGFGERSGGSGSAPHSKWDWNNGKTLWVLGGLAIFGESQGWVVFSDPKRGAFKEAQNPQNQRVDGIFFSPQVVFSVPTG